MSGIADAQALGEISGAISDAEASATASAKALDEISDSIPSEIPGGASGENAGEPRAKTPALEARAYSFAYEGSDVPVLDEVSFTLESGAFAVLCGATGTGKSTLLRAFKPELAVAGRISGEVRVFGEDPASSQPREAAARVGFVMQDPESQLVTDTVWHELAFGLENIAVEQETMRRRVAETAHFFGIGSWFDRKVADLSGGQKQLLNLASIVVMQPQALLLDEPTSQLDPIAAKDFFDVLGRINDELGITVVIVEHRLEDVLPMADRVLALERGGRLAYDGSQEGFIATLVAESNDFAAALPAATRIACLVEGRVDAHVDGRAEGRRGAGGRYPVTVKQGREYLASVVKGASPSTLPPVLDGPEELPGVPDPCGEVALRAKDLWFRYAKDDPFVLRGVDFELRRASIAALVGGNGSGKSTLLAALAGVRKPERGKIANPSGLRVALMMQDPKMLFVRDTLEDDLMEWADLAGYGLDDVRAMMDRFGLSALGGRHPYDLSGGETQKAALAKVLLLDPDVLLLDEPVKGIDAVAKALIGEQLVALAHEEGKAILFTAHDLEFVSQFAESCSMMFGCQITCTQDAHGFFLDNLFYSTATARIAHGIVPGCVTTADVAYALGKLGLRRSPEAEPPASPDEKGALR